MVPFLHVSFQEKSDKLVNWFSCHRHYTANLHAAEWIYDVNSLHSRRNPLSSIRNESQSSGPKNYQKVVVRKEVTDQINTLITQT